MKSVIQSKTIWFNQAVLMSGIIEIATSLIQSGNFSWNGLALAVVGVVGTHLRMITSTAIEK